MKLLNMIYDNEDGEINYFLSLNEKESKKTFANWLCNQREHNPLFKAKNYKLLKFIELKDKEERTIPPNFSEKEIKEYKRDFHLTKIYNVDESFMFSGDQLIKEITNALKEN